MNVTLPAGRSSTGAAAAGSLSAHPARTASRLVAVLVNWNHAADTIECVESLLASDLPLRIVIVDNASADDSLVAIRAWAAGEAPWVPPGNSLARLTTPAAPKPLPLRELSDDEALALPPGDEMLTLVRSASNRGFAGGNNLGLRHALKDPRIDYFWCLNNDTVVEHDAARAIVARMDATYNPGMCGTQVRYYHNPGFIQQLNGSRFQPLTGMSRGIGANQPVSQPFNPATVAEETDFVLGASLIVSRAFIDSIGLMEEEYFLYYEEIDWAVRNHGRFPISFAHGAIVYHKEGGSIGSTGKKKQRSSLGDYYLLKSRLKFYRRHFPLLLPLQYLLGFAQAERRFLRGQAGKGFAMLRALFHLGPPGN